MHIICRDQSVTHGFSQVLGFQEMLMMPRGDHLSLIYTVVRKDLAPLGK